MRWKSILKIKSKSNHAWISRFHVRVALPLIFKKLKRQKETSKNTIGSLEEINEAFSHSWKLIGTNFIENMEFEN